MLFFLCIQDDDEEGGEAFDFSKMEREKEEGEDDVKVRKTFPLGHVNHRKKQMV